MADRSFLRRFLVTSSIFALLIAVAAAISAYGYLGPYRGYEGERFVEVQRGMSSRDIARLLSQRGVVRSPWAFLAVRAVHPRARLQAGEYQFNTKQTPWQVFDKIRRGDIFYEEITVPEGSNLFDVAAVLGQSDTVKPEAFLKAAADPRSIRDLDPLAPNLEGYLFPSTYRVTHKTTARQLCQMMTGEFRKQWLAVGGPAQKANAHQVVTLASLVEKETAVPSERPLVAAVFRNRMERGIPLQCDPTTIYVALLENRYRGVIHRSDLASTNAYNTYAHSGLPPGPIANPGITSLQAGLQPADADFLYFVAKPNGAGSHQFSATLAEHERAVLAFRHGGGH